MNFIIRVIEALAQIADFWDMFASIWQVGGIIVALLLLFMGWRSYPFIIALPGLIFGASIGMVGSAFIPDISDIGLLIVVGVSAIVGSLLISFLHGLAVWLLGFFLTLSFLNTFFGFLGGDSFFLFLAIFGGIIFSVIYSRLRPFVSAFLGALLLGLGGLPLIIITLVGVFCQMTWAEMRDESPWTRKKHKRQKEGGDEAVDQRFAPSKAKRRKLKDEFAMFSADDFDPNAEIQIYDADR